MKNYWLNLKQRLSVKRLYDDLDYWIMIGIGSDIHELPYQRREFLPALNRARNNMSKAYSSFIVPPFADDQALAKEAREELKRELQSILILRPTFYWLLWLEIKRVLKFK